MWLHEIQLRRLGFRRQSPGYWACFRRFGLRGDEHISTYARSEVAEGPARRGWVAPLVIEVTEFHVTLPMVENFHFYYHESDGRIWPLGGHTSASEIRRLGLDPAALRDRADSIARAFLTTLGATTSAGDWTGISPAIRPRRPRWPGRS
jgi:hypothetical protein